MEPTPQSLYDEFESKFMQIDQSDTAIHILVRGADYLEFGEAFDVCCGDDDNNTYSFWFVPRLRVMAKRCSADSGPDSNHPIVHSQDYTMYLREDISGLRLNTSKPRDITFSGKDLYYSNYHGFFSQMNTNGVNTSIHWDVAINDYCIVVPPCELHTNSNHTLSQSTSN